MAIINVKDTWKYVALKTILGIYVCVLSFNLLVYWENKERENIRLLIYGTGGFGILIAALVSENFHSFLLILKIVVILSSTGILATRENIKTKNPPAELYFNTYGAIFIIVLGIIWWLFFTEYKELENKTNTSTKELNMRAMEKAKILDLDTDNSNMGPPEYTRIDKKIVPSKSFDRKRNHGLDDLIF